MRVRAFSHTGAGQSDRFVVPALARRIVDAAAGRRSDDRRRQPVTGTRPLRCTRHRARVPTPDGARCRRARSYNVCRGEGVSIGAIADGLDRPRRRQPPMWSSTKPSCGRSTYPDSSAIPPSSSRRRAGRRSTHSTTPSPPCWTTRGLRVPDGRANRAARRSPAGRAAAGADRSPRCACRRRRHPPSREPARVVDRHHVVGAPVHDQPRPRRDALGRGDRVEVRDRADPRVRIGRDTPACATRRCGARIRGTTRVRAPTCAATQAPRTSRSRARARRRPRRGSRACRRAGSPRSTRR